MTNALMYIIYHFRRPKFKASCIENTSHRVEKEHYVWKDIQKGAIYKQLFTGLKTHPMTET